MQTQQGGSAAVIRFETNRSLTGMGHERFDSPAEAKGSKPAAVVARRLFESGRVAWVHVYGNIVTVGLVPGASQGGLDEVVRDLYQYWKPGMTPPSAEELQAQVASEATPAASGGAEASTGGASSRIPAHLAERSRLAREKWNANKGG